MAVFEPNKHSPSCGGTLVASKFVITAAHCTYRKNTKGKIDKKYQPSELKVNVGEHNYRTKGETTLERLGLRLLKIHRHNNFKQVIGAKSATGSGWDIAILELKNELPLGTYTPACLPKLSDTSKFYGKTITVAGWGKDHEVPDSYPSTPKEVQLKIATSTDASDSCEYKGSKLMAKIPSMICSVSTLARGKGHCAGDSGGPGTFVQKDQHVLMGVASATSKTLEAIDIEIYRPQNQITGVAGQRGTEICGYDSIFCRVSYVRPWIDKILANAKFCTNGGEADDF